MKLTLISLLLAAAVFAGELTVNVPFDRSVLEVTEFGGYTSFYSPETYPMTRLGAPALPVLPVQIALPAESRAVSVTVAEAEYRPFRGRYTVLPATEQVPLSLMDDTPVPLPQPDPVIYSSSETFPGVSARLAGSGVLLGFPVASVSVHPVRYNPAEGTIEVLQNLVLEVEYVHDPDLRRVSTRSAQSENRTAELVRSLVLNPEGVGYSGATIVDSRDLEYGEYVIVTHPDYESAANSLAEWKTLKGVPASVVTTSWIGSNYSGVDLQQEIRIFLHDAMDAGVEYALIFGDDDKIAGRDVKISYSSTEYPPVDYYWADLNDTAPGVDKWDSNGNGVWGEYNIDDMSYYPAILTGRASVNTAGEAVTFVDKVLLYEQVSLDDRFTTAPRELRMGYSTEELWSGCYGSVGAEIIAGYVPAGWNHDKRYESSGTNSWSATNEMFNNQRHHIYVAAHGQTNYFSVPGGSYSNTNILNLTNISSGGLPAIWNSISCLIGHLDGYECMLDAWTANPDGGGFGAANARYGWGSPSSPGNGASEVLCQRIYYAHFASGQNTLGAMHFNGRYTLCPPSSDVYHWCIMNYNLFGCPELPVWTESPLQLDASHPSTFSGGGFSVTVTSGGTPVSGARVTLYKGDSYVTADVYEVATTNSSGVASFSPSPSYTGTMHVTAWKYNHLTYLGTAEVTGVGIHEEGQQSMGFTTALGSPYPSPASVSASIPFSLASAAMVNVQVFDLHGRLVATVESGEMAPGSHDIVWNLRTDSGSPVPSGLYRVRAAAGDYVETTGLMVLR